jgi:hypothetical protein
MGLTQASPNIPVSGTITTVIPLGDYLRKKQAKEVRRQKTVFARKGYK